MDYWLFCVAVEGVSEFRKEIDDKERDDEGGECGEM